MEATSSPDATVSRPTTTAAEAAAANSAVLADAGGGSNRPITPVPQQSLPTTVLNKEVAAQRAVGEAKSN